MGAYEHAVAHCYSTWGESYFKEYYGKDAPYPPVHTALVRRLLNRARSRTVLDAGCGPASMLRGLRGSGRELYGFDLTPGMVAEARRVFCRLRIDPDRIWKGSVLSRRSFQAPKGGPKQFDAVVCCGVMPHIALKDERRVLAHIRLAVKPGGIAVVEARNELFALFTMNRYSEDFMRTRLTGLETLMAKAGPGERRALRAAWTDFQRLFRMDLPPVRKGKKREPGYDEVLSRAHNPFELQERFRQAGFTGTRVLFYHYHALPPMVGAAVPQLFRKESIAMERAEDWRGHFMASAFFVVAKA